LPFVIEEKPLDLISSMANGILQMENGKWKMKNVFPHSPSLCGLWDFPIQGEIR
jgi:hypothetical protein